MTMAEWIRVYNKKNPNDHYQRDSRYTLFYKVDKGFCEVLIGNDMVIIGQLCGDARYWKNAVDEAAQKAGIKHGGTINIRDNTPAYLRLFGYKITAIENLPDGNKRYKSVHKNTGKNGFASPAFKYADGRQAFYITWDI